MFAPRPIRRLCNVSDAAAAIAPVATTPPPKISKHVQNPKPSELPALRKIKAERNPDKLFQLFKANAQNRLVIENRFAFEDTVSRLAGARRFDYIEELLEQQKTLPQGRREGFVVRIIMLYGKAGMTEHAVDTFYDMHLYRCRRTVKSFNAVLTVLTQNRKFEAITEFFFEVPKRLDIEVDIFSINIAIKGLCEMGLLQEAYLVMRESEKKGIKPDVITYTSIISACYGNNSWQIGNGLWNRMVLKGCQPNLTTFNVRIQFLVNKGRAWQANNLMRTMQKVGISPDEITFNLVIKGFCQEGNIDTAKRVFSALQGKGYKPNQLIYQTMIHYLCKTGDFDLAYTLCSNSMQKNWFPNVDTICTLMEGLKKQGQISKAWRIMILVEQRKPCFSSNCLATLRSILTSDPGDK